MTDHSQTNDSGPAARHALSPNGILPPAAEEFGDHASSDTHRDPVSNGAAAADNNTLPSNHMPPHAEPFGDLIRDDPQQRPVSNGAAATGHTLLPIEEVSPHAETCATLKQLQSHRRFCMRLQSKCDRATEAFVARLFGYHTGLKEAEGKKIFDRARRLRLAVEKLGGDHCDADPRLRNVSAGDGDGDQQADDTRIGFVAIPIILMSANARRGFDNYKAEIEKEMLALAHTLPAWDWAKSVKGFSDLGLAKIVGEAGDLSNYANPAKLWKRLGLAVLDGIRQGGLPKSASAEEWIAHGYNRQRRSEMWIIGYSLMRAQWRGIKDDKPAYSLGPYGAAYGTKKAEYLAREWKPGRADAAAMRYMTKRLVRNLWCAWNGAEPHN